MTRTIRMLWRRKDRSSPNINVPRKISSELPYSETDLDRELKKECERTILSFLLDRFGEDPEVPFCFFHISCHPAVAAHRTSASIPPDSLPYRGHGLDIGIRLPGQSLRLSD